MFKYRLLSSPYKPLGFDLSNKNLRRAALDYNEVSKVKSYENLDQCLNNISYNNLFIVTKFGDKNIFTANFKHNDAFYLGMKPQVCQKIY